MATLTSRGNFVGGRWTGKTDAGAGELSSRSPADTDHVVGRFHTGRHLVDEAVSLARDAHAAWARAPVAQRSAALGVFAEVLREERRSVAQLIASEVGKPWPDALAEADLLSKKVAINQELAARELGRTTLSDGSGWYELRPLGVIAVLGPFNFPAHLPNGHIVPALIAGNAVIFKPSEVAPATAELYVRCWERSAERSGAPAAIVSLLQGRADAGETLVQHPGVDGVAFTGSYRVGVAIRRAVIEYPSKLLALEMGGKNAMIVAPDAEIDRAANDAVHAAFSLTGQRCTATSRLLVHRAIEEELLAAIEQRLATWRTGDPFVDGIEMGPLATEGALSRFNQAQQQLRGLETLLTGPDVEATRPGHWVRPAVHRVTDELAAAGRVSEEIFGPELLVERWDEVDGALHRVAATPYGLAASIYTSRRETFEAFHRGIRAGLINWNRETAGASSSLPFGGVGHSGNHRPAGSWSLRYCTYPVATMRGD